MVGVTALPTPVPADPLPEGPAVEGAGAADEGARAADGGIALADVVDDPAGPAAVLVQPVSTTIPAATASPTPNPVLTRR